MIRHATFADYDDIIDMGIEFVNHTHHTSLHNPDVSERHLKHVFSETQRAGCLFVAEQDGILTGMVMAQIQPNVWLPEVKYLNELAWWVRADYRNTTTGVELIKAYVEFGKDLVERGIISEFTMCTLADTPVADMLRHGWQLIEKSHVYRGK